MSFLFFKNNNDKYPPLAQTLPMREQVIIKPLLLIFSGVLILWMTAQIRINLFFTPVPITGQTFGVLILAAAYGSRLGMTTILAYLFVGIAGLPVFAGASSGWSYFSGVTAGYLVGFAAAAYVVGYLSEVGWDRRPISVIASMLIGNLIILCIYKTDSSRSYLFRTIYFIFCSSLIYFISYYRFKCLCKI